MYVMARSHHEVVETTDNYFIHALTNWDSTELLDIVHPDVVFTSEIGSVFYGIKSLHLNSPEVLNVIKLEILERQISIFNNVAIVNTLEKREGQYMGLYFDGSYRLTRVWRFYGTKWKLIAASAVAI